MGLQERLGVLLKGISTASDAVMAEGESVHGAMYIASQVGYAQVRLSDGSQLEAQEVDGDMFVRADEDNPVRSVV